jgi:putative membrane protein
MTAKTPMKRLRLFAIAAAMAALPLPAAQAAPPAPSDAQIVAIYEQVNSFDIETALLGVSKAESKDVRELAMHVAADHIAVRQGVLDLAKAEHLGFDLPAARAEDALAHAALMAKLNAASGAAFDRLYLENEVAFHRAAIEAVQTVLLANVKNTVLKKHFADVLPAFEHHLKESERLAAAKR